MQDRIVGLVFFFKQKTAYEMRISDWSSDVCSSVFPIEADDAQAERVACQRNVDHSVIALPNAAAVGRHADIGQPGRVEARQIGTLRQDTKRARQRSRTEQRRSEEHTSELQSLMRISYAVFCLKKKTRITTK